MASLSRSYHLCVFMNNSVSRRRKYRLLWVSVELVIRKLPGMSGGDLLPSKNEHEKGNVFGWMYKDVLSAQWSLLCKTH